MRNGLLICITAFSVLCAFASCRKEERPVRPSQDGPAMSFSTEVAPVKSVSTDDTTLKNHSIGIYGTVSATEGGSGLSVFGTSSVTELKYGTNPPVANHEGWYYEPLQHWKRNQYYRFRAYHPFDAAEVFETGNGADNLVVIYRMVPGAVGTWDNYDLLTAFSTRFTGGADPFAPVPLKFKHALSALRFYVTYAEDNGYQGKLQDFWIEGLRAYGTMSYTHPDATTLEDVIKWNAQYYYDDKQFFLTNPGEDFTFSKPANVYAPDDKTYPPVTDTGGLIFVIPQTISQDRADGSGTDWTTVCFKTQKSGEAVNRVNLPEMTTWEPGKIYTYTLKLGTSSIEIDVTSKDWEVLESNIDISL